MGHRITCGHTVAARVLKHLKLDNGRERGRGGGREGGGGGVFIMIKSACNRLLSVSQALELEIHASDEFTVPTISSSKATPDSCFVRLDIHQWCPELRDTLFFGMFCVAKPFQNVSSCDILAARPVITKPMCLSPVTRMAVPLFGWVCEAYPRKHTMLGNILQLSKNNVAKKGGLNL